MEAEAEAQGNGLAVGQPVKHQLRPRVGAQVASQRCPTLRTAETILGPSRGQEEPLLKSSPVQRVRNRPKVGSRWAEQQRPSIQGVPQHWRNQGSNRAVHCIDGKTPLNCQNIINDKLLNLVSGKDVFPGGVYQLNSSGFGPHKPAPLLRLTLWQSGFDPTDTVRRMSGLF